MTLEKPASDWTSRSDCSYCQAFSVGDEIEAVEIDDPVTRITRIF